MISSLRPPTPVCLRELFDEPEISMRRLLLSITADLCDIRARTVISSVSGMEVLHEGVWQSRRVQGWKVSLN